jgi:hypothetical protein
VQRPQARLQRRLQVLRAQGGQVGEQQRARGSPARRRGEQARGQRVREPAARVRDDLGAQGAVLGSGRRVPGHHERAGHLPAAQDGGHRVQRHRLREAVPGGVREP